MGYISWLIVFVVFAAMELVSMGMTCIWFAIGALAACVASLLGANWIVQVIVFIIVTVAVLLSLRPLAVKFINGKTEKTNVESLVGKTGKVTKEIDNINGKGLIVVEGVEWTARSVDDSVLSEGALVTVEEVQGVKAMVKIKND